MKVTKIKLLLVLWMGFCLVMQPVMVFNLVNFGIHWIIPLVLLMSFTILNVIIWVDLNDTDKFLESQKNEV